jgi:hypothetical protein
MTGEIEDPRVRGGDDVLTELRRRPGEDNPPRMRRDRTV